MPIANPAVVYRHTGLFWAAIIWKKRGERTRLTWVGAETSYRLVFGYDYLPIARDDTLLIIDF